jgi:2-isopropylmalate synthase
MWGAFQDEYLGPHPAIELLSYETVTDDHGAKVTAQLVADGEHHTVTGSGNGPIAAFVHALQSGVGVDIEVVDYAEHAVSAGSDATAVAYVEGQSADGTIRWGVGTDESILTASLRAVLGAANRLRAAPAAESDA